MPDKCMKCGEPYRNSPTGITLGGQLVDVNSFRPLPPHTPDSPECKERQLAAAEKRVAALGLALLTIRQGYWGYPMEKLTARKMANVAKEVLDQKGEIHAKESENGVA